MADKRSTPEFEEAVKRRQQVFGSIADELKPWLFEFGNWMFGGLIAFNLVIVAPLLTLGAVHPEIVVSIVAFACALPLNVSGLVVLKLSKDMNELGIDDVVKHAFEEANVPEHFPTASSSEALAKKRADAGLSYSLRLALLSGVLTVLGMVAALWFIAWWVAVLFLIVVVVSLYITTNLATQLMRPDISKEQMRNRQAQGQPPTQTTP